MARIAIPLASDFEDSEFTVPFEDLKKHGHEVTVFGSKAGEQVQGKRGKSNAQIEATARELDPAEFDAIVIPGGYSPDHLRLDKDVVDFVRAFAQTGKLIAAVCHGPQLLIEAETVRGRTLTSWPSVRKDLENAGAKWVDREVVEDGNFVTSRKPDDLKAFAAAIERHLSAKERSKSAA